MLKSMNMNKIVKLFLLTLQITAKKDCCSHSTQGFFLLSCVFFIITTSCSSQWGGFEGKFKRECKNVADDRVIDHNDYQLLCKLIDDNPGKDEFHDLLIDTLQFKEYLKNEVRLRNVDEIKITYLDNFSEGAIERVQFFVETSASMRGYMNGGTNFQDVLNDMIGRIEGEFNIIPLETKTIAEEIRTYNVNDFANHLTQGSFHWGIHSPLHVIFQILVDSTKPGDITIFITDGIMSGTNQEVQDNPQFNVEQRTLLKNFIRRVFNPKQNELGVAIYTFTSEFNTNQNTVYYDYQNQKIPHNFTQRPFYVFVLGQKELLPKFQEEVLTRTAEFDFQEALYVGLNKPVTNFEVFLSHIKRPNAAIPNHEKCIYAREDITPDNPMKFGIGINLNGFPKYVQDVDFLNRTFNIQDKPNIKVSSLLIREFTPELLNQLNHREQPKNIANTHFINFEIERLYNDDVLKFSIVDPGNNWYQNWSTDDDRGILQDNNQTFNLKYLVDGVLEAFGEQKIIDIEIPLYIQ
jgi:hypothetical protein